VRRLVDARPSCLYPTHFGAVEAIEPIAGQLLRHLDFAESLLRAIWEEGIDLADAGALGERIAAAGFDPQALSERAQDEGLKQRLAASTDDAVERGAFGIPTIFVPAGSGRESMFFGKERLDQVEEALAA